MWTRVFNLTGRERFAVGRFLARVDANRTLAPGTLESGSRPEQVWTRPNLLQCVAQCCCCSSQYQRLDRLWPVITLPNNSLLLVLTDPAKSSKSSAHVCINLHSYYYLPNVIPNDNVDYVN